MKNEKRNNLKNGLFKYKQCERMDVLKRYLTYGEWITRDQVHKIRNEFTEIKHILCPLKGARCFTCGAKPEHRHHVIPIAKGGKNVKHNIVPLCICCHSKLDLGKNRPKPKNKRFKFQKVRIAPKGYKCPFTMPKQEIVVIPPKIVEINTFSANS